MTGEASPFGRFGNYWASPQQHGGRLRMDFVAAKRARVEKLRDLRDRDGFH
jgi:hypothetical protein